MLDVSIVHLRGTSVPDILRIPIDFKRIILLYMEIVLNRKRQPLKFRKCGENGLDS